MKEKVIITAMIGLLFLSCLSIASFAGIEPVPWHAQINRLNSVVNGLDSINRRLDDVLMPSPNRMMMPAPEGLMGRLEAMANQLDVLNDRIVAAMSGVPVEKLPDEIGMVLMDIRDGAMETATMASMGLRDDNQGVRDAFKEVYDGAMMIIETVDSYIP
jgi:hypothetical protein